MNTNEPTHQDVIDYIKQYYKDGLLCYNYIGDKLKVYAAIQFNNFKFRTLPNGLIFHSTCNLSNSFITSIPDDIVLYNSLFLFNTKITSLPALDIVGSLRISGMDISLSDGTYIKSSIDSRNTQYWYLNRVRINGYFFSTGILS